MSFAGVRNAMDQYSQNAVQARIESASPHRLIQMLLEGALGKIAAAKGYMERGEIQPKGAQIGSAISIMEGLKTSLDMEKGGEIAQNLAAPQLREVLSEIMGSDRRDLPPSALEAARPPALAPAGRIGSEPHEPAGAEHLEEVACSWDE